MVTASRTPNAAPLSQGVGIFDVAKAVALSSAPNPNAALNRFSTTDLSGGKAFDAASWASTASANASWASASWSDASWASASWNSPQLGECLLGVRLVGVRVLGERLAVRGFVGECLVGLGLLGGQRRDRGAVQRR
jgi:hypothetical protein